MKIVEWGENKVGSLRVLCFYHPDFHEKVLVVRLFKLTFFPVDSSEIYTCYTCWPHPKVQPRG